MATCPTFPPLPRRLFQLTVGFLFLVTISFHLVAAKMGWRIYRDQHLGTALEYAKGRIDLLNPRVVGFNANQAPTPQEVPLWQATAAVLFKVFGHWFGWANVASLLFAGAGLWPLFQMAKASAGERAAWWTLIFFVTQPLVFYYAGRGGTDGSCLTLTLWFVYFADLLVRTGQARWWLPAAFFGALSATTKMPFFFCAGLLCLFRLPLHDGKSVRRWLLLAGAGLFAGAAFWAWTRHCNTIIARAEFPFVDLRINAGEDGGKFMRYWYFGDLAYRLNAANWLKGGWRFLAGEFGSFVLSGLLLWGLLGLRQRLGQLWMLAGAMTTLVFTHLVLHHSQYYLMVSPAVAMLCGVAVEKLECTLAITGPWAQRVAVPAAAGLLLLATIQGLIAMKVALDLDPYPGRIAALIRQHTSPADKLLIRGGGWGGHLLFLSEREGLSIWSTEFLEKPENLARIRQLGFTKLVAVSESPLLTAVQQTNPGQASQRRETYHNSLTRLVSPWPILLQTEDLLIKEIPAP